MDLIYNLKKVVRADFLYVIGARVNLLQKEWKKLCPCFNLLCLCYIWADNIVKTGWAGFACDYILNHRLMLESSTSGFVYLPDPPQHHY